MYKKYDTLKIKEILSKEGYELLSEYKHPAFVIVVKCSKKHEFETTWNSFQQGHRCRECFNERQSNLFRGSGNPQWKGEKRKDKDGYVIIYSENHKHNRVLEHRFLMEEKLGRVLKPWELVHHINGIKNDNRIENLCLIDKRKSTHDTHTKVKILQERIRYLERILNDRENRTNK